jgi:ubiquinone/menaquinone biosynthesis C-methylase UbiE
MSQENKPKAMSDASFKLMTWTFRLVDLFARPRRHLAKVQVREGMTVVDYGCGPGRYTIPLAELVGPGGKVFAVDIQPLAIRTVKEKAARKSLTNIEAVLANSYTTAIPASSADIVLLFDTVHMIKDHDALFHEIHRLLKPDGFLFMDPGHMRMPRAREIVESTGLLTMVKCRGRDMLLTKKPSSEASDR